MSYGMTLFVSVGLILGVSFYLNYRMGMRNRRHAAIYESDVLKFDQVVHRNDWREIKE